MPAIEGADLPGLRPRRQALRPGAPTSSRRRAADAPSLPRGAASGGAPSPQQTAEAGGAVVHDVVGGAPEEVELGAGNALEKFQSPRNRHGGVLLRPDQQHRDRERPEVGKEVLFLELHVGTVVGVPGGQVAKQVHLPVSIARRKFSLRTLS